MTGSTTAGGQQKTFKIHVRNDVDQNIQFRETAPAVGPVVEVPKDVTAGVDYVDRDQMGKLVFEAVGKNKETGKEIKFLLNGQPNFVVDEQNLSSTGEFVVVHKQGDEWEKTLASMRQKAAAGGTPLGGSMTTVGGSTVMPGGINGTTTTMTSDGSHTTMGGGMVNGQNGNMTSGSNGAGGSMNMGGSGGISTIGGGSNGMTGGSNETPVISGNGDMTSTSGGNGGATGGQSGNMAIGQSGGMTTVGSGSSGISSGQNGSTTTGGNGGMTTVGGGGMNGMAGGGAEMTTIGGGSSGMNGGQNGSTTMGGSGGMTTAGNGGGGMTIGGGMNGMAGGQNGSMALGGSGGMTTIGGGGSGMGGGQNGSTNLGGTIGGIDGIGGGQNGNSMSVHGGGGPAVGNFFMLNAANLANEDAVLKQEDGQEFPINKKATLSAGLQGNGSYVFTAKGKSGTSLYIDGELKKTLTEADMPATLVVHEKGELIISFSREKKSD